MQYYLEYDVCDTVHTYIVVWLVIYLLASSSSGRSTYLLIPPKAASHTPKQKQKDFCAGSNSLPSDTPTWAANVREGWQCHCTSCTAQQILEAFNQPPCLWEEGWLVRLGMTFTFFLLQLVLPTKCPLTITTGIVLVCCDEDERKLHPNQRNSGVMRDTVFLVVMDTDTCSVSDTMDHSLRF